MGKRNPARRASETAPPISRISVHEAIPLGRQLDKVLQTHHDEDLEWAYASLGITLHNFANRLRREDERSLTA